MDAPAGPIEQLPDLEGLHGVLARYHRSTDPAERRSLRRTMREKYHYRLSDAVPQN